MPTAVYLNGLLWSRRSLLSRKRGSPFRSIVGLFARSSLAPAENLRYAIEFNTPIPTIMLSCLKARRMSSAPVFVSRHLFRVVNQ